MAFDKIVEYDESQIDVLEGLEAVRKRPAMYIGSTNSIGLHHCIWEIINNSIDEGRMGYCDKIEVEILKDNYVKVTDNGRGIPCGIHPKKGISTLEVILLTLHAGGKFGEGGYVKSGGLHGIGTSAVNALSDYLSVEVKRDGNIYKQEYSKGKKTTEVNIIGQSDENGTMFLFHPDNSIFKDTIEFDYETIKNRIKEMAFLNSNITFILRDNRELETKEETFHYADGINAYINEQCEEKNKILDKNIYIKKHNYEKDVDVEICFNYIDKYGENLMSLVNSINTIENGTHVNGFYEGMAKVFSKFARDNNIIKAKELDFIKDDIKEGLIAIVSCGVNEPEFEGQTKTKLGDSYVKTVVLNVIKDYMELFCFENKDIAMEITERIHQTQLMRNKVKKIKVDNKSKGTKPLPDKLTDYTIFSRDVCEIYIVEGDSAGGSAKQGANKRFQAILPTKGKVLNIEKATSDRALNSETLNIFSQSIGIEPLEKFDKNKLRFFKIIIMSDADVDGSHIKTLWTTYVYRYYKWMIEEGILYYAMPPLFKITSKKGNNSCYAYSDEERDVKIVEYGGADNVDIQRYKGLGEMNPTQLWDTTMNPETRVLARVTLQDAEREENMFRILMGEEVAPRQEFIINNSSIAEISC